MSFRLLLPLFLAGTLLVHASAPINAPVAGASASVKQPHIVAELIPETTNIQPGQSFAIALHLHADPGWHTYWINPGESGLATTITWTLPPGFTAGEIQWPTPEKHNMGPIITFGYEGDVYLLTTITPPQDIPRGSNGIKIKARADWLVCQEECIPGHADLELPLDSGLMTLRLAANNTDFFAQARERLPVPNTLWEIVDAVYSEDLLAVFFKGKTPLPDPQNVQFFAEQPNVISVQEGPLFETTEDGFALGMPLQQNGEKPNALSGVLVSTQPLVGSAKAIYISKFPVALQEAIAGIGNTPPATTAGARKAMIQTATEALESKAAADHAPVSTSNNHSSSPALPTQAASGGPGYSLPGSPQATGSADGGHGPPLQAPPFLLAVLGAAFIGGLILNLMPCVLPVLSLKVFALVKHAQEDSQAAWKQGVAFTAGVVLSFWLLAAVLLILRGLGNQLGWGFQMQSPGFVLGLIFLFFILGLNLFGLFELGTSLAGLDAKVTGKFHGLTSSFLNGALATLAATPCTAPFMGSSLGFAAQQPAFVALLIFTFLALGMAAPYLLLTIFPGALRFVPKPGAWMEAFKQFMGFLLMATVIFLIYVFGALVGEDRVPWLLMCLLFISLAAWIYGKWITFDRDRPLARRLIPLILALVVLAIGLKGGVALALSPMEETTAVASSDKSGWQPWSAAAVQAGLAQNRPVFVDFTAAWCLSCKANEQFVLGTDAVKQAFARKNVLLLKADWTHADPAISQELRKYNRDGVPLYLLYSPKNKETPQVLPEVLTPGIVLDAVGRL